MSTDHDMNRGPILLVAAHPDDEVIGAGIQLTRWTPTNLTILHITNGSPTNPADAQAAGFSTAEDYMHARRKELYCALDVAGLRPDQCLDWKYVDQETGQHLVELTERLAALLHELRPESVYTHPYEGGHPDHDSAAFAVSEAVKIVTASDGEMAAPHTFEFTSYHAGPKGLTFNEFLGGGETELVTPTAEQMELKRKMIACYATQRKMLGQLRIGPEKFRPAPIYNFEQPPHDGPLHYESLGWNVTGEQWRQQAAQARKALSLKQIV